MRVYKYVNSPSIIVTSVVSPVVSFLFACLPKLTKCGFSASMQTKRLAFDLMCSRLSDGREKFRSVYRLFPHFLKRHRGVGRNSHIIF